MNNIIKLTAYTFFALILVLVLYQTANKFYWDHVSNELQQQFSKIPEVKNFHYYDYEGGTHAELQLAGGKYLVISGFDSSVFTKANHFYLDNINGLSLICRTEKNSPLSNSAVDFNSLLKASQMGFEVHNINDLIFHYDEIYANFKSIFPQNPNDAKPIKMSNLVDKNAFHWCHTEVNLIKQ